MPTTAEQIESLLEERDLTFFKNGDEDWMVPYDSFYVCIRLLEGGTFLRFYGAKLADLEPLSPGERHDALQHFMELNDQIRLGRFCGFPKVNFEVGLPVVDGELTSRQFHRCLGVTIQTTAEERYVPQPSFASVESEPFLLPETPRLPPENSSPKGD